MSKNIREIITQLNGISLLMANLKGGVGKTTTTALCSTELAKLDFKTAMIDMDTSSDLTDHTFNTMLRVHNTDPKNYYDTTMYYAMENNLSSKEIEIPVTKNLTIVPSNEDFDNYESFLDSKFNNQKDKDFFAKHYFQDLKSRNDFTFFDVPPSRNIFTDSAIVASDYVIIVIETQQKSFKNAKRFAKNIAALRNKYNLGITALGVLFVLNDKDDDYDANVISQATEYFGAENVFKDIVTRSARVKRWDWTGVTDNPKDPHDRRLHKFYTGIAKEIIERIERTESEDN